MEDVLIRHVYILILINMIECFNFLCVSSHSHKFYISIFLYIIWMSLFLFLVWLYYYYSIIMRLIITICIIIFLIFRLECIWKLQKIVKKLIRINVRMLICRIKVLELPFISDKVKIIHNLRQMTLFENIRLLRRHSSSSSSSSSSEFTQIKLKHFSRISLSQN